MKGEKMIKSALKYGILFGFAGFTLTLISWYFATGMLDPRFPAVIGSGLFAGGFLGSLIRRLHKEGGKEGQILFSLPSFCLQPFF